VQPAVGVNGNAVAPVLADMHLSADSSAEALPCCARQEPEAAQALAIEQDDGPGA